MPCRDPELDRLSNRKTKEKLNAVTQFLCSLCEELEFRELSHLIRDAGVDDWWAEHKEFDEKRNR